MDVQKQYKNALRDKIVETFQQDFEHEAIDSLFYLDEVAQQFLQWNFGGIQILFSLGAKDVILLPQFGASNDESDFGLRNSFKYVITINTFHIKCIISRNETNSTEKIILLIGIYKILQL
jgi:hypothetical protein